MQADLELVRDGTVVRVISVTDTPVHLGRHPDNTMVLLDEDVSGHHAIVAPRADGFWVVDLRSTNGTWLDEERVEEARLHDGATLRLALGCVFRVKVQARARRSTYMLHDHTAGTVYPLRTAYAHIGSGPGSLVRLPAGPARVATVTVHDGAELWLEDDDGGRPLALGETFTAAGHAFAVERAAPSAGTTYSFEACPLETYALAVDLDAPGGPAATLTDTADGSAHTVVGETRVALLYTLAKRRLEERGADAPAQRRPEAVAGWIDDEDALVAVWGKAGLRQAASGYSVLLHRLRKELDGAGFDPSFLEKRRGATRLRLDRLTLGGGGV